MALLWPYNIPEFKILISPYPLWPSIPIAVSIAFIHKLVEHFLNDTATRITQHTLSLSKPSWLCHPDTKSLSHESALSTSKYTIPSLTELRRIEQHIEELHDESEFHILRRYGSSIGFHQHQLRELKSWFLGVKSFGVQRAKFLESTFKLIVIVPITVFGIYVVYFEHDFFVHHWKQWFFEGQNEALWDPAGCSVVGANKPLVQQYDDWMVLYYVVSLGYHLNRALTQFSNPSRKDFVALFVHHWTTLILMTGSFVSGRIRCNCHLTHFGKNFSVSLCFWHNLVEHDFSGRAALRWPSTNTAIFSWKPASFLRTAATIAVQTYFLCFSWSAGSYSECTVSSRNCCGPFRLTATHTFGTVTVRWPSNWYPLDSSVSSR